ncbi:hypothetical protein FACUT_6775 [Fusarium acutatum]|uniref:Uncharacterized protein n=1 Tax=Fusarium acutatum TaxID=78861 RepID=A0A8H4NFP7_9HYPO|nr:hypothetical protein FACUT_6775 [Fusarium acutatum]
MAAAGPSGCRLATGRAESTQNSHSADSARQLSPPRIPLRSRSPCESFTKIPKPSSRLSSSHRRHSYSSLVHSSKSSSGPSRSGSPTSSPASSVQEDSITDEEIKEPEPDLTKAPEHFKTVFSVPKALFHIDEDCRQWHFSFAPMQDVHVLVMELNEANLKPEKAEQQVRDLTQGSSSVAEPGPKIQPSERERKCPEVEKVTPAKLRRKRCERRRQLIENPNKMPLDERFEELAKWSEDVEADIDAAQGRNTVLFDDLGKASQDISRLTDEKLSLKTSKEKLEKQLEESRKHTTIADDDQTSAVPSARPLQPLASQNDQENRLAELQRENERLRQENDEMRNALEQPQSQNSPPEEPESQINEATPEEAQLRSADAGVEVPSADVEMGGITTGQDSTAPKDIEAPVMPVTPPAAPEAEETLVLNPQLLLSSINRDSKSRSDNVRRRRESRRHEQGRRREQKRLEREKAQQQQKRRSEKGEDARRLRKHHRKSPKTATTISKEFPDSDAIPHPFRSRIGSFKAPRYNIFTGVTVPKPRAVYSDELSSLLITAIITLCVFDAPSR